MTDTDTSKEAVERLARSLAFVANRTGMTVEKCEQVTDETAATLRALSARVAELECALQRTVAVSEGVIRALAADNAELQAQLADARDKAKSALARLDASLFTNAEHQQAKDILRAMKGKP